MWPDSWFTDGALRQIPKYDRPHCRLLRPLYGHPQAGALLEARLYEIMKKLGWFSVRSNGGVYVHAKTKAAMVVYVNDMLLLSAPRDTALLRCELEKNMDYKDPAAPLQRYLGALYLFDAFDPSKPKAPCMITPRTLCSDSKPNLVRSLHERPRRTFLLKNSTR